MTRRVLATAVLLALASLASTVGKVPDSAATTSTIHTFSTPDEAVNALVGAMRSDNAVALRNVLGPGSDPLIQSGDRVADAQARQRFLAAYDAKHAIVPGPLGRMVLTVGEDDWPLPIPIVMSSGRWLFDSHIGARVLIERRIGRNEIAAVRTALAYVDAQRLYFRLTSQRGAGEYAQRLVSTLGEHDGLYWPARAGEPDSPLEPLVRQAVSEGYPGANVSGRPAPYYGYYFRILTAQGDNAPGGPRRYVVDGRMTEGFAMIAWPAVYGVSGIMTFEVNQDGVIYQKDLGAETDSEAPKLQLFDPDLSWVRVDITGR